jgi:hypothetical protein
MSVQNAAWERGFVAFRQGLRRLVAGSHSCNSRATGFASLLQSIVWRRWSVSETGGGLSGPESPVAELSRSERAGVGWAWPGETVNLSLPLSLPS